MISPFEEEHYYLKLRIFAIGRDGSAIELAGVVIQRSTSADVVRITDIAFRWMAPTPAVGSVMRNARTSFVVSPSDLPHRGPIRCGETN